MRTLSISEIAYRECTRSHDHLTLDPRSTDHRGGATGSKGHELILLQGAILSQDQWF